jgi:hypothetical protein
MTHYFNTADDPNVINELRNAIYRGRCILFAGSSLSTQASTEDGVHPPNWKDLLERMAQWCLERDLIDRETAEGILVLVNDGFLINAGQEIEEYLLRSQQLHHCLREVLLCDKAQVSEVHRLLVEIPFRTYLTTNYDIFIETAYSMVKHRLLAKFYEFSIQNAIMEYRERTDIPFIVKLHGDIENANSITLGDRTFERFLSNASNYWRDLENLLAMSSVLFIGFEKSDYDLEGFISKIRVFNKSYKHWMVVPGSIFPVLRAKRLREDKGIRIIQYRDDSTHSELIKFLRDLTSPPSPVRLPFEEGVRSNRIEIITELEPIRSRQIDPKTTLSPNMDNFPSPVSISAEAIEVFYSYAQEDSELCQKLDRGLTVMKWQGLITDWHPLKISAGEEWEREINGHLNTAGIILLLVSPDFFTESIYQAQISRAIERHNAGEACVIPIILRPTFDWGNVPFGEFQLGRLQPLPKNGKPVTKWPNKDEVFKMIAEGIKEAVEQLNSNPKHTSSS